MEEEQKGEGKGKGKGKEARRKEGRRGSSATRKAMGLSEEAVRKGEVLSKPKTRREWILFFHEYRKAKQKNDRLLREKESASTKLQQTSIALAKAKRTKWILEKDQEILQNQHSSLTTAQKSDVNHIERMEGTLTLFKETKAVTEERQYAKRCRSLHYTPKDEQFQGHFNLPPTEYQIDCFFASYEGKWGHIYISPSFLCFDEGWSPYKTPSGIPHVLGMIKEVVRVKKTKAVYVAEVIGLLLANGGVVCLFFLNSSSPFLECLFRQSKKFGVQLGVSKNNFPSSPPSPLKDQGEEREEPRPPSLSRSSTPPPIPTSFAPSFLAPPRIVTTPNSSSEPVVPPPSNSSINSTYLDTISRPRSSSSSSSSPFSSFFSSFSNTPN